MELFEIIQTNKVFIFFAFVSVCSIFFVLKKKNNKQSSFKQTAFTHDLVLDAKMGKIEPIIGRDEEIERVIHILLRKTKNNPILLGAPGVGKTAVVDGLAIRIAAGNVPENLKNKKVLLVDMAGMISGTKYRGEFEERVKKLLNDVLSAKRQVILFIDEVHMIVQAKGSEGALNVSDILKPALARGDLQTIGATTSQEYESLIRPDDALNRRFQPVLVGEPTIENAMHILKGIKPVYEAYHKVKYTDAAIRAAVVLSDAYIKDRFLPDKAIDLIDEAGAAVGIETTQVGRHPIALLHAAALSSSKKSKFSQEIPIVDTKEIKKIVAEWVGKPVESLHLTKKVK